VVRLSHLSLITNVTTHLVKNTRRIGLENEVGKSIP